MAVNLAYTSYGGADINIAIGNVVVGNSLGISLSITREKAPIFVLGNVSPVSFSRGKRGIAGSLVALNTDVDAFRAIKDQDDSKFWRKPTEWAQGQVVRNNATLSTEGVSALEWTYSSPFYADQVMPFNITIVGHNETSPTKASMKIFDCEILNEGLGISLGDTQMESQMTFIARTVHPWAAIE